MAGKNRRRGRLMMISSDAPRIRQAQLEAFYSAQKLLENALEVYENQRQILLAELAAGVEIEPGTCELIEEHRGESTVLAVRKGRG